MPSPSNIQIQTGVIPNHDELVALYDSVGWQAYTFDPATLEAAVRGSLLVVTARDLDGKLVGLARIVGDGHSIAYLQDVLVDPEYQRHGLGRTLMNAAFEPFARCRQHVLITDTEPRQRAFYESMGFTESRDFEGFELRCFVRFNFPE